MATLTKVRLKIDQHMLPKLLRGEIKYGRRFVQPASCPSHNHPSRQPKRYHINSSMKYRLTRSINMLKCRQLPLSHFLHHILHSPIRHDVRLYRRDALASSYIAEQLLRRSLVAHDGEDVKFKAQSGVDGRGADVACSSDDQDGLHFGWWWW